MVYSLLQHFGAARSQHLIMKAPPFGFKEDDSERGNNASEDCRIRQLVIGFEQQI
jgi:hypothetical protein